MWSLPDINRLNEEASARAKTNSKKTTKQLLRGKKCEWCEERKATIVYEYYDIFSDDPKGYIFLCEGHDGYSGSPMEGYFTCSDCERVHVQNYTWENYLHVTEEGEELCLNCYFDREIAKEERWISAPDQITDDLIAKAPHIIPVEGKHWGKHLAFIGNVEFDSTTGARLYGTREDGIVELRELVKKAGVPCILILDAAYQFAVSIGVYTRKAV